MTSEQLIKGIENLAKEVETWERIDEDRKKQIKLLEISAKMKNEKIERLEQELLDIRSKHTD